MNLAVMLRRTANAFGDRPAVVMPDSTVTWGELYGRSCRLAQGLMALDVGPRDVVATLGDNSIELLESVAACALGNFVRSALYPYNSPQINGYLLDHIGARALVVERKYYEPLRQELAARPHVHVIVIDGAEGGATSYDQLLEAGGADDPMVPVHDDDPHIIRFSSGTTGKPKAIWHSTGRWRGQSVDFAAILPTMDERDRFLAAGSMTHIAVGNLWQIIQSGACVYPMRAFEPGEALQLIDEHRLTYAVAAPVMIKAMVEHPDIATRDLSSLRCLWYAGSPIAESTLQAAVKHMGDALFQVYGMSESSPMTVLRPDEHIALPGSKRHRSAGRPQPNMDLKIVDDDGHQLVPGEIGEIAARSHGTMSGIWKDEAATQARMLDDGSIRTRDVGYFDAQGYLHLVDRKDDMIISGGYNIWPAELEAALIEHPAIREACVVGVPHDRWGETPLAAVVLRAGADEPSEQDLIDHVRERVGTYKKPSRVTVVSDLPRTGTGKVLRRLLRDQYAAGADRIAGS